MFLELCNLKLVNFDCSYNRIIRLPLNLREMISLIEFNVENNPLESPPASVTKKRLYYIKRNIFYFEGVYAWITSYNALSTC